MAASTSEGSCSSTGDLVAAVFDAPRGAISSGIHKGFIRCYFLKYSDIYNYSGNT